MAIQVKTVVPQTEEKVGCGGEYCCYGCCRTHVKQGAAFFAMLGLALCTISLLVIFTNADNKYQKMEFLLVLLRGLLFMLIIVGDKKGQPGYFLPYLVGAALAIAMEAVFLFFMLPMLVAVDEKEVNDFNKEFAHKGEHYSIGEVRYFYALVVLAMSVGLAIHVWIYTVIYRAYKFMKMTNTAAMLPQYV